MTKTMRNYGKVCTISGKKFSANFDNFTVIKTVTTDFIRITKALTTSEEQLEQA